eukprot:TRINITY_DN2423_c0_g1_i3.p1 TRINITY_DN2423_c0_g1~~TRINITY_DN2423_c0_g1_i3.p1  ORF type:complete len:352 (+),score=93.62 TRINITY_DN2423_c0_g1_i3:30-1085(+)
MFEELPYYVVGLISFIVLVFASWCVGEGGEVLGKKYDASIIGGLVIAWLNTAPEAIFFITALESSNPRFAVGAVSGSSVVVCTIALGACLYIGTNARKSRSIVLQPQVKRQCMILGMSLSVTLATAIFGFQMLCGVAGVLFYIGFIINSLQTRIPDGEKEDDVELGMGEEEDEHEEDVPTYKGVLYLVAGGLLIFGFSKPFISSVVEAASSLKVNPVLLAFFLAPIASEMPEILESVSLSRKGSSQNINIAYSNLVGGTITKTTLLTGILSLYGVSRGFVWESPSFSVSLILLVICASATAGIGYFFPKQQSWHALFLVGLFIVTGIIEYTTNSSFEEHTAEHIQMEQVMT